jgi:hypothetical protein
MKKIFFSLLAISMCVVSVAVFSCKDDEESDLEKGKKAGEALCSCIRAAGDDETAQAKCESVVDLSKIINIDAEDPTKWTEYQKGFMVGVIDCADLFFDDSDY